MTSQMLKLMFLTVMVIPGCDDAGEPPEVEASNPIASDFQISGSAPSAGGRALAGGGVDAATLAAASDVLLGERLRFGEHGKAHEGESEHYIAHCDDATHSFVVARKEGTVVPKTGAAAARSEAYELLSMQIAEALGVQPDEVGAVAQRELMQQNSDSDGALSAPELVAHKTFILRALHGIEVQGSRLVVSHDPEGRLQRIAGVWPALAADGHQLTTPLSSRQVMARVEGVLAEHHRTLRDVELRYVYVPEDVAGGAVRLRLHVSALVAGIPGSLSGPQELLIDILP